MDNFYGAFTQHQNRFLYLNIYWDGGFYSAISRRKLGSRRSCSRIFWGFFFVFGEIFSPIPQQTAILTHTVLLLHISLVLDEGNSQSFLLIPFIGYQWQNKTCFPCKDMVFFFSASSYIYYIFSPKQYNSFPKTVFSNVGRYCHDRNQDTSSLTGFSPMYGF